MPRAYRWHRGIVQSIAAAQSADLAVTLPTTATTTLIRVRFQINFQWYSAIPFNHRPRGLVVYGLYIIDSNVTTAPQYPITNAANDWLWYEGLSWTKYGEQFSSPTYPISEGPIDGGNRSAEGQRKTNFDNLQLHWSYETTGDAFSGPVSWVDVTYEALTLLPA